MKNVKKELSKIKDVFDIKLKNEIIKETETEVEHEKEIIEFFCNELESIIKVLQFIKTYKDSSFDYEVETSYYYNCDDDNYNVVIKISQF